MKEKEIKKLLNSKVYPHKVKYLKLRETYISWLVFTGSFVYKIKKPVKYGFLDFSSFLKRKFFLEEELKLNKRLSPEIYLDIAPIAAKSGRLRILESSQTPLFKNEKIKECALKMREIPERYYAPDLLKKRKIKKKQIKKIAKIVALFHKRAQANPEIRRYGSIKIIKKNCEENFRQTRPFVSKVINEILYNFITRETRSFLVKNRALFLKRQKEGRIRDCHGDLHTENIFITPQKIHIIDCIEFNKRFRYQDTASDVAFLAMDFDYSGKPDFADYFIKQYNAEFNDKDLSQILPFYKCYRAYVRAKVGCFSLPPHLIRCGGEPKPTEATEARPLSVEILAIQRYFSLAFKYVLEFSKKKPFLLILCGQIGTGKSFLAEYLAKIIGARLLRSDVARKEMLNIPLFEHRKKGLEKIYSRGTTIRVYKKLISQGLKFLKQGEIVILDATFATEFYRKMAIAAAEKEKFPYFFVECRASEKKILARLRKRIQKKEISDATVNVYLQKRGDFEKVKLPKENYILINTENENIEEEANKVLKKILN